MRSLRPVLALVAVLAAYGAAASPASADFNQSITAELQQPPNAVPGVSVAVGAPVGDETATTATNVLHVTMTPPQGVPLAGILPPASGPAIFTTTAATIGLWDLEIVEAAKHANKSGAAIDGISITRNYAGEPASSVPDMIWTMGDDETPAAGSGSVSDAQVSAAVQTALPAWAANATIQVSTDAAGQRVVTVSIWLPSLQFAAINPDSAIDALVDQQNALQAQGANVGRVTMMINDKVTGDPFYVAGADSFIGFSTTWRSPLIQGLLGPLVPGTNLADTTPVADAVNSVP
jgi:hypothetical protein